MNEGPSGAVQRMAQRLRGTFMEALGINIPEMGNGRAVAEVQVRDQFRQLTGVVHAGVLVTLADTAATAASLSVLDPSGSFEVPSFPFTVQLSTNLISNTSSGRLVAEAVALHRGRTTHVVEVKVTDGGGRLLALMTATLLMVSRSGGGR